MLKPRYAALLATTLLLLSACSSGDTPNETPSASTETPSTSTENPSTSTETPSTSTETPSTSTDGSPSNYIQIAAGGSHTCAVLTTGGVRCWGYNFNGHLGESTPPDWKPTSEDVVGLSSKVVSIAAGREHTCALLGTGGVQCWGDSSMNDSGPPRDVEGLSSKAVSIAAVWQHTCALLDTGGVQCWGWNNTGQLGNGTEIASDTPVDVVGLSAKVVSIAVGDAVCALLDTGGVQCWGDNEDGQLGNGNVTNSSTPVDVVGLSAKVVSIAAGGYHMCALLDTGGAQCWGYNLDGQLGNGNVANSSTPVDVTEHR